jgi:hypothetical protein
MAEIGEEIGTMLCRREEVGGGAAGGGAEVEGGVERAEDETARRAEGRVGGERVHSRCGWAGR